MKYNKRYLLLMSIFCMLAVVVFYAGTCDVDKRREIPNFPAAPFDFDCTDGIDNDEDGLIDCEDTVDCCDLLECEDDPNCVEAGNCSDMVDNDGDQFVDCDDVLDCCDEPECEDDPACMGPGTTFTINLTLINNSNQLVNFLEINEPFANTLLRPFQSRIVLIFDIMIGDILTFVVQNPRGGTLLVEEDCQVVPEVPVGPDPFSGGTGNVIFDGSTITCEGDVRPGTDFVGSP